MAIRLRLFQTMIERATFAIQEADAPHLRAVVSRLARLRYSEHSIKDRLGVADLSDLHWRASPIYRSERLASRDPLASAIDLFLLQGGVTANELNRLFDPSDLDLLKRAGLLEIDDHGTARARASLFPVGNCLIFSDHAWPGLPHPGYADTPYDQVMSVGRDSRNLAHGIPRRPFHSALDLCAGSGIHAVLASKHAEHVLAIDINPRAAQCTRFNAQVSAIPNLEVMVGDLFEAVRGKRFDLITANPPFVPSPLATLRFRDGGPPAKMSRSELSPACPATSLPVALPRLSLNSVSEITSLSFIVCANGSTALRWISTSCGSANTLRSNMRLDMRRETIIRRFWIPPRNGPAIFKPMATSGWFP